LWGDFLSWGRFPIDFHDWAEVNAPRLALVRDAVQKGVFPFHINETWPLRGITDRFLSIPDTLISPQVLLMGFLNVQEFVFFNQLIVYTIGSLGLIWLNKRLRLSPISYSFLFLVFHFNGHIVSHMSIGHTSWGGYYLFPWFAGAIFTLLDEKPGWKWITFLGLTLAVTLLQGSFHQFTWMLLFLGFFLMSRWKNLFSVMKGILAGVTLAIFRLLPPVLLLGQFDDEYKGGYSNPIWIFQSLLTNVKPSEAMNHIFPTSPLGWWEFDSFIGVGGTILIALGITGWLLRSIKDKSFPVLLLPITGLTLLSISKLYGWFRLIPVPLLSGERVASRMISLALFFTLVIAALEIDRWMQLKGRQRIWKLGYFILICISGYEMVSHMIDWAVARVFPFFPFTPVDLSLIHVANRVDPIYEWMIMGGFGVSLAGAGILTWLVLREKAKKCNFR
jgi:hypothetical protein